MAGYHLIEPPRGEFGELSKVYEETAELADADKQGATLMLLQELSDLIGAIEGYLNKHHPTITLDDLIKMKDITKRAFESGARSSRTPASATQKVYGKGKNRYMLAGKTKIYLDDDIK